jgi:HK97 family phage portal protein
MAGITTQQLDKNSNIRAIVGIPGWAQDFQDKVSVSAKDPISAYASVPLLYRAVNLRSSSISAVPFLTYDGDEEVDFPLSPDISTIIYQMELGLMLCGVAYGLKKYKAGGRVLTGLQILNPSTIQWHHSKSGEDTFTQHVNGRKYGPFSRDEMVVLREPSMTSDVGPGLAPAQVAIQAGQLGFNIQQFSSAFFEQGAMPTTILSTNSNPNAAELERTQSFFRRQISGVASAFKTLMVRGDIKISQLTPELKSLALEHLNDEVCLAISASLNIPQSLLRSDANSYATSQADIYQFYNMVIRGRIPIYQQMFNDQILAGTSFSCLAMPETMEVYQHDEHLRSSSLLNLVNAGMPLNEAKLVLGYDVSENTGEPPKPDNDVSVSEVDAKEEMVDKEMASWQRYALRNFGRENVRPFVVHHIPPYIAGEIQYDLNHAYTPEAIKNAFLHQQVKRTPVVPRGNSADIETVPAPEDITIELEEAIKLWNKTMPPEARGMLESTVIDKWRGPQDNLDDD